MKHGVSGYKLKRDGGSRKALLKGLVTSVIEHERVITTIPKAKAVQPLVEKMITFDKLGTRFGQRTGGYTRVVRLGFRKGDGAEQAMLELVGSELVKRATERAKRREERMQAMRQGKEEGEAPEE